MAELIDVPAGLAGVAVADTEIGDVVGARGYFHYRGQSAPKLAQTSTFEQVAALVLDGSAEPLDGDRSLPPAMGAVVGHLDLRSGLSALGTALGCRPLTEIDPQRRRADAVRLISVFPTLVASLHHGRVVDPDPDLGHVADYLRMMRGTEASAEAIAALEAFFILMIDHGLSNSAFTTRVVASVGSDLAGCVVAAFASLSGPQHGANTERVLDMFDEIGEPEAAKDWMKSEMQARRRLNGFGHSVYSRPDPRLVLMREMGAIVAPERHRMAIAVEAAGTEVLAGRRLAPNIDLHAPVVLEGAGIPRGWFTATFAAARIAGWCAHALEQAEEGRIFRPAARYVGPPPDDDIY